MVDKELLEQFQIIVKGMSDMEKRLVEAVEESVQASEVRMNIKMENEITRRIDSLFDGYKLVHEKQWELERQAELLRSQISELQVRIAALENRIA